MFNRKTGRIVLIAGTILLLMVFITSQFAITATNTVPSIRLSEERITITAEDVKPNFCAAITLSQKLSGSGTIFGTPANDLILGSAAPDRIFGMGGDDCIIGGSGDDRIIGGAGYDICSGGPGANFIICEVIVP